jgi:hypothetical protein
MNARLKWARRFDGRVFETRVVRTGLPGVVDIIQGNVLVDRQDGTAMAYIISPSGNTQWAEPTFATVNAAKRWVRQQLKGWM